MVQRDYFLLLNRLYFIWLLIAEAFNANKWLLLTVVRMFDLFSLRIMMRMSVKLFRIFFFSPFPFPLFLFTGSCCSDITNPALLWSRSVQTPLTPLQGDACTMKRKTWRSKMVAFCRQNGRILSFTRRILSFFGGGSQSVVCHKKGSQSVVFSCLPALKKV